MRRYRMNVLGVSEVRWTGADKISFLTGEVFYYSGRENEDSDMDTKDEFYSKLQEQLSKVPSHDILILMGDLNAKLGKDNTGFEKNMGKQGLGIRNENGERFLELCMENDLVIGGTIFQHKKIHKETWISPDGKTKNQIDHVAINHRWRTSLQDVKAIRGADIDSDHHLVLCKLRLKLKKVKQAKKEQLFNSQKLKDAATHQKFSIELSNRFHLLDDIPADDLNNYCNKVQEAFLHTSEKTLGYQESHRKPWISDDTWKLIEERRCLKHSVLSGGSRLSQSNPYKEKSKEVKKSARNDKRRYIEGKAQEAEDAEKRGDTKTLYKITRELTSSRTASCSVIKDKDGKHLVTEDEQRTRWAEHFNTILNRPEPETQAEIRCSSTREFEMNKRPITCTEIEEAIKETKGNRAPGEDKITADMLKADPTLSAKCLVELFNKVWKEEEVPDAWKKGIIIKLPKKGDLKDCGTGEGLICCLFQGKFSAGLC